MATTVKNQKELIPGKTYKLSELPDNVTFSVRTRKYRTLTYPTYNTKNPGHQKRSCFNLRTMETEELLNKTVVKYF